MVDIGALWSVWAGVLEQQLSSGLCLVLLRVVTFPSAVSLHICPNVKVMYTSLACICFMNGPDARKFAKVSHFMANQVR